MWLLICILPFIARYKCNHWKTVQRQEDCMCVAWHGEDVAPLSWVTECQSPVARVCTCFPLTGRVIPIEKELELDWADEIPLPLGASYPLMLSHNCHYLDTDWMFLHSRWLLIWRRLVWRCRESLSVVPAAVYPTQRSPALVSCCGVLCQVCLHVSFSQFNHLLCVFLNEKRLDSAVQPSACVFLCSIIH